MKRSKLEMYVDILQVLAQRGPLKVTHIMYKANVNFSVLKEYLDFLLKQGLVEERTIRKQRIVYAVTQRGITVLKYFKELKQVLPLVEEARNQERIYLSVDVGTKTAGEPIKSTKRISSKSSDWCS
jgi:predicted transcriptional regulator